MEGHRRSETVRNKPPFWFATSLLTEKEIEMKTSIVSICTILAFGLASWQTIMAHRIGNSWIPFGSMVNGQMQG
jgi:hypothetical protein